MKHIETLYSYLIAVFVDSGQRVLTLIDLIGLISIFFPDIVIQLGIQESMSRSIGIALVIFSFAVANYKLYARDKRSELDLILGRRSTSLKQFVIATKDQIIILIPKNWTTS